MGSLLDDSRSDNARPERHPGEDGPGPGSAPDRPSTGQQGPPDGDDEFVIAPLDLSDLDPGDATRVIRPVGELPPGTRVLLVARSSHPRQGETLNDLDGAVWLHHAARQRGAEVVGVVRRVMSGYRPEDWIPEVAAEAKRLGAVIVAESTDRLVRHTSYQPTELAWYHRANEKHLDALAKAAGGVEMFTVLHPNTSAEGVRLYQARRGVAMKALQPDGARKATAGRKKALRPLALALVRAGHTMRAVGRTLQVSDGTIRDWVGKDGGESDGPVTVRTEKFGAVEIGSVPDGIDPDQPGSIGAVRTGQDGDDQEGLKCPESTQLTQPAAPELSPTHEPGDVNTRRPSGSSDSSRSDAAGDGQAAVTTAHPDDVEWEAMSNDELWRRGEARRRAREAGPPREETPPEQPTGKVMTDEDFAAACERVRKALAGFGEVLARRVPGWPED